MTHGRPWRPPATPLPVPATGTAVRASPHHHVGGPAVEDAVPRGRPPLQAQSSSITASRVHVVAVVEEDVRLRAEDAARGSCRRSRCRPPGCRARRRWPAARARRPARRGSASRSEAGCSAAPARTADGHDDQAATRGRHRRAAPPVSEPRPSAPRAMPGTSTSDATGMLRAATSPAPKTTRGTATRHAGRRTRQAPPPGAPASRTGRWPGRREVGGLPLDDVREGLLAAEQARPGTQEHAARAGRRPPRRMPTRGPHRGPAARARRRSPSSRRPTARQPEHQQAERERAVGVDPHREPAGTSHRGSSGPSVGDEQRTPRASTSPTSRGRSVHVPSARSPRASPTMAIHGTSQARPRVRATTRRATAVTAASTASRTRTAPPPTTGRATA